MNKFKEILQQIKTIIGKQPLSFLCLLVAIVAIVLPFYPTAGWFTKLQGQLDASLANAQSINSLITKQRNLPLMSFDPNAQPQPLAVFPTQAWIDVGTVKVDKMGKLSQSAFSDESARNKHYPLVDGVLPSGSEIKREEFVKVYLAAMGPSTANTYPRICAWPTPDAVSQRHDLLADVPPLQGGHTPTQDEIAQDQARLTADINQKYWVINPATQQPTPDSAQQATQVLNDTIKDRPDELKADVASSSKIYIEPGSIKMPDVYAKFQTMTSGPAPADIWAAQLHLWVCEDVATGLAFVNRASTSVMDSPAKQIDNLQLAVPPYLLTNGALGAGDVTTAITPVFDNTPTGRVCNGMYDVVQFNLVLDVDASKVTDVLSALQLKQRITILSVQYDTVDSSDRGLAAFYYGKSPVVKLDMQCEEVFLRDWEKAIQPPDAVPGGGGAAAPAGGATPPTGPGATITFTPPGHFARGS